MVLFVSPASCVSLQYGGSSYYVFYYYKFAGEYEHHIVMLHVYCIVANLVTLDAVLIQPSLILNYYTLLKLLNASPVPVPSYD